MQRISILLTLITIMFSTIASANTIYVTDSLQLKLRASANTDGEVVTTLHSGQKLSVLERQSKFTRVKTLEGQIGWVQSWFLTDKPPATYIVNQISEEKENLENKLALANDKLKNFDSATARENESLKNSVNTLSSKIKRLTTEQDELANKLETQSSELAKYKFAEKYDLRVIILTFFLISFSLGFWAARVFAWNRERRRLSGYRLAH